jgi:hypothetical protein
MCILLAQPQFESSVQSLLVATSALSICKFMEPSLAKAESLDQFCLFSVYKYKFETTPPILL